MPPLTILIKPASGSCNLHCKYCFYRDIMAKRDNKLFGMMSDDTLLQLVKRALNESEQSISFAFQGGEPTLTGLDFYKRFIEYINKYNHKNLKVFKYIQTNATLIDDDWAKFFADNQFLVGVSLDGNKEFHDLYRIDLSRNGSFNRVINTTRLLDKYKVQYNILCVVTHQTARHIDKIYSYFAKNGFRYLQFIPCLDPIDEKRGNREYSLSPKDYTYFLKRLFDRWYSDLTQNNYISIRQFDNYINMILGYPAENCSMSGICYCYFVVEADGSVYPCDFYVLDKWRLGDIFADSFDELKSSQIALDFVNDSKSINNKCLSCKWFRICRGGCRRDKEPIDNNRPLLNYFCESYYEFFDYAFPKMTEVARKIKYPPKTT